MHIRDLLKSNALQYLLITVYLLSLASLLLLVNQASFVQIFISYTLAFSSFILLTQFFNSTKTKLLMALSYIIALFSFPVLSNDVYRFLWDGYCTIHSISPFAFTPHELLPSIHNREWAALYTQLNSKMYFSVYPAICQLIFNISVGLGKNLLTQVFILKLIYLAFHAMAYYFAKKMDVEEGRNHPWMLYFLNPLVIVEGIGNVHAEVVMVGLLLPFLYYFLKNKNFHSAFFLSLAFATKITPLMLLPFIIYHCYKNKNYQFIFLLVIFSLCLFFPFFIGRDLSGFASSLNLYFSKFEFNASIYYIMRWFGKVITSYNQIAIIGPLLAFILTIFILLQSYFYSKRILNLNSFASMVIIILSAHLIMSTTVHPWYLTTLILFACICDLRFPIVWSYLIILSYSHYASYAFKENMWMIAIEYLLLLICVLVIDITKISTKKQINI